jgi:hypothetical protein
VKWAEMTTDQKNAHIDAIRDQRLAREAAAGETEQDEENAS